MMDGENKVKNKPSGSAGGPLRVRRQTALIESVAGQIGNIYTEAFPPSQRVDFDTLIAAVSMGERRLFTAEAEGEVVGFAITVPLPDTGIHCLEYLAVKRGQRGRGTGSILLRSVLGDLAATENALGLILEVESDREGSEAERESRRARIAFYHRSGAHMMDDVPCFMAPNLVDGGTLEMKLMWLPAGNGTLRLLAPGCWPVCAASTASPTDCRWMIPGRVYPQRRSLLSLLPLGGREYGIGGHPAFSMEAYHARICWQDSSGGPDCRQIKIEQPPEEFYRTYWGGSAMGTYYLLKNTPPGADPWDRRTRCPSCSRRRPASPSAGRAAAPPRPRARSPA